MTPDNQTRVPANKLSSFDCYRFQCCCLCDGSMLIGDDLKWDGYVVADHVWQVEANMDINAGAAHRACLQIRLGRQLQPQDFMNCGVTTGHMGKDPSKWVGPPLGEPPDCRNWFGPHYSLSKGKLDIADYVSAFDSPTGHLVGRRFPWGVSWGSSADYPAPEQVG